MTDSASVTTAYTDDRVTLLHGDCIEAMRSMPDSSVDSIVTDPPYGLGFMGKAWDDLPPGLPWAQECLRVLKPGGHLLAFGGSRTWHRLAVAVEDAGFEIRDSIAWLYGSGFPKSLDVSKAIDKAAGAEREVVGVKSYGDGVRVTGSMFGGAAGKWRWGSEWLAWEDLPESAVNFYTASATAERLETAPSTEAARQWAGWGTALKPAFEPVVVGRKPLEGKTVAANVLLHGTGALNIDASRIATDELKPYSPGVHRASPSTFNDDSWQGREEVKPAPPGRWPANVVLDEGQAAALDTQSGTLTSGANPTRRGADVDRTAFGDFAGQDDVVAVRGVDVGGASRFFYCAKAPKSERPTVDGYSHSTVKPLTLMRYLVKLVTPPGGTVLDTFAGSGATIEAALLEGFNVIGVERSPLAPEDDDNIGLCRVRIDRFNASVTDREFDDWLAAAQETLI